MFLGLDPGKSKCGLAVVGIDRKLWLQEVVPTTDAPKRVSQILTQFPISSVILGNGTGSKPWKEQLQSQVRVILVDEKFTTLEARQRYWELYPPKGIGRWLPLKLRFPPKDLDGIVALILIDRYLTQLTAN